LWRQEGFFIPFGEVTRVFPKRVVAAEDIDQSQEDFVGRVVDVNDDPIDAFVPAAEVDFVEDLRF
jgi:hypothetical protein